RGRARSLLARSGWKRSRPLRAPSSPLLYSPPGSPRALRREYASLPRECVLQLRRRPQHHSGRVQHSAQPHVPRLVRPVSLSFPGSPGNARTPSGLFFPGVAPLAAGARPVRSAHDARRDGPPLRAARGDEELDQLRSEPDSAERGGRGAGARGVPETSPGTRLNWAADATEGSPISAPTRRAGGDEKPSRGAAEKPASSLCHDGRVGEHK